MNMTPMLPQGPGRLRLYTLLTGLTIILLLVTAGAGLFGSAIYDDFMPRAQDLITLVLGIPLPLIALYGARRERAWSVPLWTGVLAYELYIYAIYAVGGVYNDLFLGYVAVASLSLYTIIGLLSSVNAIHLQQAAQDGLPRRWIGGFFLMIVIVFGMIWIGEVMNSISTGIEPSGHLIFVFDLGIVLPAFAIAAVKLFRKQAFGDLLAGMLLIKFVSLCVSITLGQVFRSSHGLDVESQLLSVFIPLGLIGLGLSALYFRQLIRGHSTVSGDEALEKPVPENSQQPL
jgi:hypothetical protein